jgi:SP family sugar:H+ symporter-like MFS transporter
MHIANSNQGQISGILIFKDFIQRFGQDQGNGEKAFDPTISSLLVSLMSIGTLVGALAGAYTADWFGRRRNLSIGVFIFVIGNIIQVTAMNTWVHMTIGRIVAGLGVGILSIGVPMYQSEVCPREIRGAVVASYQLMITVGILSKCESDLDLDLQCTYHVCSFQHYQLRCSCQPGR